MTKSRKKILLSSSAMLLVALVALGSATFAWFTMNKTVSADGMTVTAATSAGLQITGTNGTVASGQSADKAWVRDFHFADLNAILTPTSLGYTSSAIQTNSFLPGEVEREGPYVAAEGTNTASATSWAQGDAIPKSAIEAVSGGADASAVTTNNQIAGYRVGVRSSRADTDISGVTMQVAFDSTNATNSAGDFIRIVVVDSSDAVVAYYAGGGAAAVTSVASNLPNSTAAQPTTNSLTYALTTDVTNANPQYFNIYVWYEGQDAQCVDAHQAAEGALSITFSYT